MTQQEKWATLEPFLRARLKTEAQKPWMNLLIKHLARKADGK
jgi:hypothetical protein